MKKILLSTIAAATLAVVGANAKTITVNAKTVASEGTISTANIEFVGGVDLNMTVGAPHNANDLIKVNISEGSFAASTLYMNCSDDNNMTSLSVSGTEALFRVGSAGYVAGVECSLNTADDLAGATGDDVNITGATLANAETLTINFNSFLGSTSTEIDAATAAATIATGTTQFDGNVSATVLDGIINVANDRQQFTLPTNGSNQVDNLQLGFTNNAGSIDQLAVILNGSDSVALTLTGDTTGVSGATFTGQNGVVNGTVGSGSITFALDGDEIDTTSAAYDVNVTTDGTTTLATRTFTVGATLTLADESKTVDLVTSGSAAGSWTVNGATYEMINMADNGLGTVTTAIRLINTDASNTAEVYATVTNRTNGTAAYDEFRLTTKDIAANGSVVVTASDIITAAAAAGNDITVNDDFSVSLMVTVPQTSSEAIAVQRSGTGQRVLGNTADDFTLGN